MSEDLLSVAVRAARAGGDVIDAARRHRRFVVTKKSRADFVTDVDVAAERAIVAVLSAERSRDLILGEEGGEQGGGDGAASGPSATGLGDLSAIRWVIDPLDGTTNFMHDIPIFAVSVAAERDGRPVVAAILDVPRGDLYTAARAAGAHANGALLGVSPCEDVGAALVLTGIPFRTLEVLPTYLVGLERVARASAGIRRMGSAALDLCFVAAGKAEAFWEHRLARWDVSAGALLVEEAGGRVTDLSGAGAWLESGDILASNGRVHDALLDCVRSP